MTTPASGGSGSSPSSTGHNFIERLIQQQAQMMAANCMVYSNSTNNKGLEAKDSAIIAAGLICTAGGRYKGSKAQLTPDPVTDCPVMDNPLASRAGPSVGA